MFFRTWQAWLLRRAQKWAFTTRKYQKIRGIATIITCVLYSASKYLWKTDVLETESRSIWYRLLEWVFGNLAAKLELTALPFTSGTFHPLWQWSVQWCANSWWTYLSVPSLGWATGCMFTSLTDMTTGAPLSLVSSAFLFHPMPYLPHCHKLQPVNPDYPFNQKKMTLMRKLFTWGQCEWTFVHEPPVSLMKR